MNRMRWSLPLGGIKSCQEKCVVRCRRTELNVPDEQTVSGREFQLVGAAAWKE